MLLLFFNHPIFKQNYLSDKTINLLFKLVFGYFWIVKQVNVMSLWLVWLDTCVNLGADFIQQIKSTIFE